MLTRFEVSGFKNLRDVVVDFGPFTCIAGPNGAGKSNLFDAIQLLSALSRTSFSRAFGEIRAGGGQRGTVRSMLSPRVLAGEENLRLAAELPGLLPSAGGHLAGAAVEGAGRAARHGAGIPIPARRLSARPGRRGLGQVPLRGDPRNRCRGARRRAERLEEAARAARGHHDRVQALPGRGVGGLTRGAGPARGEPVASQSRSRDGGCPLIGRGRPGHLIPTAGHSGPRCRSPSAPAGRKRWPTRTFNLTRASFGDVAS